MMKTWNELGSESNDFPCQVTHCCAKTEQLIKINKYHEFLILGGNNYCKTVILHVIYTQIFYCSLFYLFIYLYFNTTLVPKCQYNPREATVALNVRIFFLHRYK